MKKYSFNTKSSEPIQCQDVISFTSLIGTDLKDIDSKPITSDSNGSKNMSGPSPSSAEPLIDIENTSSKVFSAALQARDEESDDEIYMGAVRSIICPLQTILQITQIN